MSFVLWPVFEDGQDHSLCDEGAPVFRAYEKLDAIAVAAGHKPLEAFDDHADGPAAMVAQLAEEAEDLPDLSGFPVGGHDPADAVAAIDVILAALASPDPGWDADCAKSSWRIAAFPATIRSCSLRALPYGADSPEAPVREPVTPRPRRVSPPGAG